MLSLMMLLTSSPTKEIFIHANDEEKTQRQSKTAPSRIARASQRQRKEREGGSVRRLGVRGWRSDGKRGCRAARAVEVNTLAALLLTSSLFVSSMATLGYARVDSSSQQRRKRARLASTPIRRGDSQRSWSRRAVLPSSVSLSPLPLPRTHRGLRTLSLLFSKLS